MQNLAVIRQGKPAGRFHHAPNVVAGDFSGAGCQRQTGAAGNPQDVRPAQAHDRRFHQGAGLRLRPISRGADGAGHAIQVNDRALPPVLRLRFTQARKTQGNIIARRDDFPDQNACRGATEIDGDKGIPFLVHFWLERSCFSVIHGDDAPEERAGACESALITTCPSNRRSTERTFANFCCHWPIWLA